MKKMLKDTDKQISKYFHFSDFNEFVIFLIWALLASAVLINLA